MTDIVQQITDYMERNNLSQTAFAQLLGCKQPTVSRWLSGTNTIRTTYYCKFLELLEQEKERDAACRDN